MHTASSTNATTLTNFPLVAIPGFMLTESLWQGVSEQLPEQSMISASLTQGDSINAMADAIALKAPEQFVAMGFSLGGYVARALVERYPERVKGLIIIASSLRADTPSQQQAKQTAINALAQTSFQGLSRKTIAHSLHPSQAENAELIRAIQLMSKTLGFEEFVKQSLLDRNGITQRAITCPTFVVGSREDRLRSLEEMNEIVDLIPHASTAVIDGVGHMLPLEAPVALAALIREWITQTHV